jgi:WD40 repeat protein
MGVCELTLNRHTDPVWAIAVIDGLRVCSCSRDRTLKLWNVSSGLCKRTLKGHTERVKTVLLWLYN